MMDTPTRLPGPVITAQTVRNFLVCERRVWLDAHGDWMLRGEVPEETHRLYVLGSLHEQRLHETTAGEIEPIAISSWEEGVTVTADLMRRGVPGIIGACLEYRTPLDLSDTLYTVRGRVDRLVRVVHHGDRLYSPVEIKQHASPVDADWVQLDFYVWLLGLIQGRTPPAELWLGANVYGEPRRRVVHEYDEDRLMEALARVIVLPGAGDEPPVHLAPHCKSCPWYGLCQETARHDHSIDLLYGVSRRTREQMRQAGLVTLAHVAALTPEALQQVKGIGPVSAPAIHANARAWLKQQPVWYSHLPDVCTQSGWMFDLETLEVGGRTVPWCMGWCDVQGNTHIALVGPVQVPEPLTLPDGQAITVVPDSDSAWETFAAAVSGRDSPVFHWSGYDASLLRSTAPKAVREQLEPRFHDLHATLKRSVSLPLHSTSIKIVSTYLGFPWPGYADWFAAYLDYRYWLDENNLEALTHACLYQRADVQSMAWVWRWMVADRPTTLE
jgi:predicted RecB family nuclease